MNKLKRRNFVQEFSLRINRAAVFTDRRLEEKKAIKSTRKILRTNIAIMAISFKPVSF